MKYLLASEYETYGLDAATAPTWITSASALMDAHCRRSTLGIAQYTERLRLTAGRNNVSLTFLPLAIVPPASTPVVAARGRYGPSRRGETPLNELACDVARTFALPGAWTDLDPASVEFSAASGELVLPANALGLSFNEVEVTYTAGLAVVPDGVKVACAQIVRNALATPALTVRSGTLDRMHLEYFSDTLLDADVRALLAPYMAQRIAP
jgi:hypothetical protein